MIRQLPSMQIMFRLLLANDRYTNILDTSTCQVLVDVAGVVADSARYFDIWAAGVAINFMCVVGKRTAGISSHNGKLVATSSPTLLAEHGAG